MTRRLVIGLLVAHALLTAVAAARSSAGLTEQIARAITELDLAHAGRLLEAADYDSPALSFERARLAVYRGDCDTAWAILSSPTYTSTAEGAALGDLARSCAGATAASVVEHDQARGIWIRLQDDNDRPLVPYIARVASDARAALYRDLGVALPRPLRIELVRDVFSLSAVSGLPVQAAETTGTVAVARWGRVAMITPRAMRHGYPWEDTLAHEMTHLALTRATLDRAPLWLQEGVAKRQEIRWRDSRPCDETPYDGIAAAALLAGQSVGIQAIGPSIAMLPSADAARIAYAEVTSFVRYWTHQNTEPALWLLLADLKGLDQSGIDSAMRSVTGYELSVWEERWKRQLLASAKKGAFETQADCASKASPPTLGAAASAGSAKSIIRWVRLGDMLFDGGHFDAAARQYDQAVAAAPNEPAVRWRAARALLDLGQEPEAKVRLGDMNQLNSVHGPWFALHGRLLHEAGRTEAAERDFSLAIAVDPLREDVACEGHWSRPGADVKSDSVSHVPGSPERRALCKAARQIRSQD